MTWTPDRPTKPGKYEVYIAPECRDGMARRLPSGYAICIVTHDGHELIARFVDGGIPRRVNAYDGFTRALWRPYVEPPDPFAKPVPSLRERVERLPTYDYHTGFEEIERMQDGEYLKRSDVLALLDEVTR